MSIPVPTDKAVGSTDPRDLIYNAHALDMRENSELPTYPDRFGVARDTRQGQQDQFNIAQNGRELQFQTFLTNSGFVSLGNYAAGLNFTAYNQYVARDGFFYRPAPSSIPFTTTGTWVGGDENLFRLFSADDVLRQDLSSDTDPNLGAGLIPRAIRRINSIAELRTVAGRYQDDTAYLVDYYGGWNAYAVPHPVGFGELSWDAASTEADNGIDVFAVAGVATGRWKRPQTPDVPLGWGGIKGQDADETALFVAMFAWADGKKLTLHGEAGAQYRMTDTARLNNSSLDFHGATLTFAHVGNNALLGLFQEAGIENVRIVCAGSIVGSVGNAGQRPIVGLDSRNCKFRNIIFDGVAVNNIAPLTILGDAYNFEVENISIPGTQLWAQGVIIHWATDDDSAVADFKDIAYLATALNPTTHPRNFTVTNVQCGVMTGGGTLNTALFLSGCYNVKADNITLESAARLLTIYPGDFAADFAPAEHADKLTTNIRINNIACTTVTSRGIVVGGLGVNSVVPTKTDVVIDGVHVVVPQTTFPLLASYCDGLVVQNGELRGGQYVAAFGESSKNSTLRNLRITGGKERGVSSGFNNTTDNINIRVIDCEIFGNNTDATASFNNSGIYFERTYGARASGNKFGRKGVAETQRASVYVATVGAKLSDNHTYGAAQSFAYYGATASPYSMDLWTDNNTSDTAFTTGGHAWYESMPFGNRRHYLVASSGAPASGTHEAGDEVIYQTPAAGGFRGSVCTTAGTPGTWKTFGAISA